MSSSHRWERSFVNESSPAFEWERSPAGEWERNPRGVSRFWMLLDVLTILAAAGAATLYKKEIGVFAGLKSFWNDTLIPGATSWELLIILLGFMAFATRWGYYDGWRDGKHDSQLSLSKPPTEQDRYKLVPDHGLHPDIPRTAYKAAYRTAYLHGYDYGAKSVNGISSQPPR